MAIFVICYSHDWGLKDFNWSMSVYYIIVTLRTAFEYFVGCIQKLFIAKVDKRWMEGQLTLAMLDIYICLFVLLLYVPSQQLWSLRDGEFT